MIARSAVALLIASAFGASMAAEPSAAVFTLRDHLNRDWTSELVQFAVESGVFGRNDLVLLGPEGTPVVHQWVPARQAASGKDSIAFAASVRRFGTSVYRLVPGSPAKETDLRIGPWDGGVQLDNGLIGVRLAGPEAVRRGPIAAIRLPSGRWVGAGELGGPWPPGKTTVSAEVTAQGPVFADALVTYDLPKPWFWRLKFRVVAGEPVVLVDEEFRLPEGASYALHLGQGWNPTAMFHRGMVHDVKTTPLGGSPGRPAFLLESWSPWGGETPRGNWVSLFEAGSDDLLTIGCREPGVWVEPGRTRWDASVPLHGPKATAAFQLCGFARKWMLSGLSKARSVTDKDSFAPLPQQLLIRHGDLPLDMVKDYVLAWDERGTRHPRLLVTAAELERFRRGFQVSQETFISPERGFSANPNMTTTARGMLGMVACTIPNHPAARGWAGLAIEEIGRELDQWCDAEGGWLEAPHYMTVSMDSIVGLSLALRETGFSSTAWEFHPKLRKTAEWLARISTPPDPRLKGIRRMPEIGNTYLGEPTCLSGWMARIWRERDPRFAAWMQWAWKAQGSPRTLGIGGAYPATQGYRVLMFDESIPAAVPPWASHLFPETGAVLRAHFPGDRETYLHYIQGRMHQHYDYDEGSFILWGKGQPLCEDFGYYGRAPAADHSRVDDGFVEQLGNEGNIREFAAGAADYLRGERAGWNRQVLFVKDDDPLGPNFFVLRDSLPSGRPGDWRVWVAAAEPPSVAANPVRVKGRFGADLAVFFADPPQPQLATQPLTRRAGASGFATAESTQHSLHLRMPAGQPVAAVLYPLMKDQPTPRFTALANGRVVKIESSYGTDYAMLALEPFRFQADGVDFEGKAGTVQVRPRGVRLSLPCRGKASCQGKAIENPQDGSTTMTRS